ncbi:DUF2304 domain-containing protein [Rhodoferax sp. BLA1]|uniref:DUF2304 domain-containing protein n=1 Tax=Rhodoferax sp. BLA1 TaxID=2576062 RepID=UPI0015D2CA35|nr:DUF2304 domain-containing protein [Rhodoferax sp. BLA1]
MILTSLLTVIFAFMAVYCAIFIRRAAVRYFIFFAYIAAIFFVWNPNETTIIANYFGIGRGLDFVMVLFSVAIVNGTFFIIKHLNSQHQSITKLARHMAVHEACSPLRVGDTPSVGAK